MAKERRYLLSGCLLLVGFVAGWLGRDWIASTSAARSARTEVSPVKPLAPAALPPEDGKLRIIAFGAHPDDCELKAGGVAAKWAALGHHVKFVSVTNGDIGHWKSAGGPLAKRRTEEVEKAARILGITTQVLDIHDGELEPTLANRRTITRLIREWNADIVLSHRPNDYHPDHRYTGVLVQDAAFMVGVPFFCPDTPPLKKNPVFLFYSDRFERPNPFRADIIVDVDDVMEKKLNAIDTLVSQFYEGGALGSADLIPKDAAGKEDRLRKVRQSFVDRAQGVAKNHRDRLVALYGKEHGGKVQHAEAFEICEYGSQPSAKEIRKLFPFFGSVVARSASEGKAGTAFKISGGLPIFSVDRLCLGQVKDVTPPEQGTPAWTIPWDADWVTAVTFVGQGRKLAAGNKLGQILLWDLPDKAGGDLPPPLKRLDGHTNMITALAATPDGRWLISASYDHTVRLWDMQGPAKGKDKVLLKGGRPSKTKKVAELEFPVEVQEAAKVLASHKEWVRSLSLSGDGKQLLTGDDKGLSILWDLPEAKEARRWQVKGWLQAVALSPDGRLGVTCVYAPRYAEFPTANHVWDATTGTPKADLDALFKRKGGSGTIGMTAAAFSLDNNTLALGQGGEVDTGKVFLIDVAKNTKLHELSGHQYGVNALVFHPDGKHLASAGRDTTVRIWRIADGKQVTELSKGRGGQFKDWIHSVSFTSDGRLAALADMAGQIQVWELGKK